MSQITTYDSLREYLLFLNDSYVGEPKYSNPSPSVLTNATVVSRYIDKNGNIVEAGGKSFRTYLIPHDGESTTDFQARINSAGYINLCKPIVSAYVDSATGSTKRDLNLLDAVLQDNVDYRDSTYDEFIRSCATEFAIFGFSFVIVDTDEFGSPKFIRIDPSKVAYIVCDDYGTIEEFVWINQSQYLNETRPSVQNVVVTKLNADGFTKLSGQIDYSQGWTTDQLKIESSTPLSPALEGKLPLVVGFFERDNSSIIPLGVSLISEQARIGRTIYNLLSYATDILKMHFPMLVLPVKDSGGAIPPDMAKQIGNKFALPYDSETNAPQYLNPSKESTEELRAHADWLARWAFKLASIDVDQASVPQSGVSLRIKSRDFETKVKRFAKELQKFEIKLLNMAATVSGISAKDITISYPEIFTSLDYSETIANTLQVLNLSQTIDIGDKAKLLAIKHLLSTALPITDFQLTEVLKEIETRIAAARQPQLQQSVDSGVPSEEG
jgi:hypothetical protein